MDALVSHPAYGPLLCLVSSLLFSLLGFVISKCLVPQCVDSKWKYKNVSVSLTHSAITAVGALFSFYIQPDMLQDLIVTHSAVSYSLVCLSWGYFLYDSVDMFVNQRKKDTYELLGHHAVILICFGTAVLHRVYVGYAIVALMVEVNSVFLHARQLLQLVGVDKTGLRFRLISLLNVGTFIPFRLVTLSWMTRWLVYHRSQVPFVAFALASVGLAITMVMNIFLLLRIFKKDFSSSKKDLKGP